ncbi:DegT/DnrJ/EryC1/StrS family aminotransferase [Seonamhaeicola maritimus]|uniref:DegT/DnrJ/EryC1/StrS family aminotransferase n=1 Tax=Seonamhaeicola maritimus TaxID=2591822 RepID=A0A5C7GKN7_9FLAO|nr:DegT/DnrJ/EryC1/StrS family aminotransferase [Seonamhaeicola maritimus]TXG38854.1 DegT/DnrJ/EryC1/StrS family aminotransferase [Seonamhaeicola maritimus]
MINVTKTFLPPQDEYQAILNRAWETGWITNRGVLVKELENKLKKYLNVNHVVAMTNGTLPLQIAIKVLGLKGEIITTPFSYVATTSSIVWEGCKPIFVDIHPEYLTIDETKIEAAITPDTSAILATHVFGNPCHIEAIDAIAKKHHLKVIYDAAHCFGVTYKGQSIFNYGDVSTCSFHATKLFHTGEGGALFTNSKALYDKAYYHHNFGHLGEEAFQGLGINAKMSELQAAMGLAVFPYLNAIIEERKSIFIFYQEAFKMHNISSLSLRPETVWNYGYYPIIFETEEVLLRVKKALNEAQIFPRRYFFPNLGKLNYVKSNMGNIPISQKVSKTILCLPFYSGLGELNIKRIKEIVLSEL